MRCGYINVKTILTERELLSQRTLQPFRDNCTYRDLLPVIDRHLLTKDDSYFRKSSKETLELWESRVKAVLKTINIRDNDQPCVNTLFQRQRYLNKRNLDIARPLTFAEHVRPIDDLIQQA